MTVYGKKVEKKVECEEAKEAPAVECKVEAKEATAVECKVECKEALAEAPKEAPANKFKFNLVKGAYDPRDIKLVCKSFKQLPPKIDLSKGFPPVWDQSTIGSCTGQASGAILQYLLRVKKGIEFKSNPSRLFIYTNGRIEDGYPVDEDTGCSIKGGLKALSHNFAPDERSHWWYIQQNALVKPPQKVYDNAMKVPGFKYLAVQQTIGDLKGELAQGFPVVLGIAIYDSFFSEQSMKQGLVPLPDKTNENLQGWHAVCLVGYDDADQTFLIRNSWGTGCGLVDKRGYFKISYSFILHPTLAIDIWTMRV